jgi:hypothetical protein
VDDDGCGDVGDREKEIGNEDEAATIAEPVLP